jgi:outer membrane protein OmpA-like peptidoglycan-associated protein
MSRMTRVAFVCAMATLSLSACATRGALRRGLEEERVARVAADSAQQVELAAQRAELVALRTDLGALRTEFGAKIAEVAEGVKFALPIHFAYDDATVRSTDVAALERFASVVQKHFTGAKLTVEGFADPAGTPDYNLALSQRRADAVRDFISGKGVDPSLVNAVGYGETRLVNRGAERDMPGAELNRRVVFVIETPANAELTKMALMTPIP